MSVNNDETIASVDLGSNSFRLQICRNRQGQMQIIDSIKEMVRLAGGLDGKKNLSKEAQERALACLARFSERLRGLSSSQVRVVATNTFRVAKNITPFIKKAEKVLGFPIDVIAGREEARLIYTGVVHTLPFHGQKGLIVDIGGGSTEFIIGSDIQPIITESLPLGCVSTNLRFFANGKITVKNFNEAVANTRLEVQRIRGELQACSWDFAIGTSGSAKSIRDVIQDKYGDIDIIDAKHMDDLVTTLTSSGSVRKAFPTVKADRIEVFAGGLAVMYGIFKELGIEKMQTTDAALRDGVFYDLIGRQLKQDMREETVNQFQLRYQVDIAQAKRIENFTLGFLKNFKKQMNETEWQYWNQCLSWASKLHEIGLSIAHTAYHKHSAYILENADMPGFSRKEQQTVSALVYGHRGDLKKMKPFSDKKLFMPALLCLRLGALFCRGRVDITFPDNFSLEINIDKKICTLKIPKTWLINNPLSTDALYEEAAQWKKINYQFQIKKI